MFSYDSGRFLVAVKIAVTRKQFLSHGNRNRKQHFLGKEKPPMHDACKSGRFRDKNSPSRFVDCVWFLGIEQWSHAIGES